MLNGQVPQPRKPCENIGYNNAYMSLVHTQQGAYNSFEWCQRYLTILRIQFESVSRLNQLCQYQLMI
jgi:hypothetical protein